MKLIKHLAVLIMTATVSVSSISKPATEDSIKSLMQRTSAGDLSVQMMNQMIPALKKMIPNAPEKFWADVMSEVDGDSIVNMTIPVYQKYLTEEDVIAINIFYSSPAGKKLISVQPAIMQESMMIGQEWGQNIAKQVLAKYEAQSKSQP